MFAVQLSKTRMIIMKFDSPWAVSKNASGWIPRLLSELKSDVEKKGSSDASESSVLKPINRIH